MTLLIGLGLAQAACCGMFLLTLLLVGPAKQRRPPSRLRAGVLLSLPVALGALAYACSGTWWPGVVVWGGGSFGVLIAALAARRSANQAAGKAPGSLAS
jgi:hypothetical protein